MPEEKKSPPFTAYVDACFDCEGVWRIDAHVVYRDGVVPRIGDDLLGRARLALLAGIAREGLRGRSLGADRVIVYLDAGDGVREIDLDALLDGPRTIH